MQSTSLNFKHTLIICSRDRVPSLLKTLETVSSQVMGTAPSKILLVINLVDQSDLQQLHAGLKDIRLQEVEILYTRTGLPSARNLALSNIVETDVVHFIDDDVLVNQSYFMDVDKFFQSHPNASGGAPVRMVRGLSHRLPRMKVLRRRFGLLANVGEVTHSMRNSWGETHTENYFEVDWLPGLAMFYRFKDINGQFFNEKLEECPLGGYGLGEDLFFSLSLSSSGKKLFATPNICVSHTELPNAARGSKRTDFARGELRNHLLQEFPDRFSKVHYLGSLALELALSLFTAPDNFRNQLGPVVRELKGFLNKHQL